MKDDFMKAMTPEEATRRIRSIAPGCKLSWTESVATMLLELGLIIGDLHHVLVNGEVIEQGRASSMAGLYKYVIECRTPNHPESNIRLIVLPSMSNWLKICEIL